MNRLDLEAFKAKVDVSETEELESLSGGILGACHSPSFAEMVLFILTH